MFGACVVIKDEPQEPDSQEPRSVKPAQKRLLDIHHRARHSSAFPRASSFITVLDELGIEKYDQMRSKALEFAVARRLQQRDENLAKRVQQEALIGPTLLRRMGRHSPRLGIMK